MCVFFSAISSKLLLILNLNNRCMPWSNLIIWCAASVFIGADKWSSYFPSEIQFHNFQRKFIKKNHCILNFQSPFSNMSAIQLTLLATYLVYSASSPPEKRIGVKTQSSSWSRLILKIAFNLKVEDQIPVCPVFCVCVVIGK